jgi:FlaA1/EpsC-like NDP-sugar epimerase
MFLSNKNTPRWLVFILDLFICLFSIVLAYLLRFNFAIPAIEIGNMKLVIPYVLAIRGLSFYISKIYAGIIRYTSSKDAQRIFVVNSITSIIIGSLNFATFFLFKIYFVPFSIVIIDVITTIFLMTSLRLLIKILYLELLNPNKTKTKVIIYGAGESGIITKRALDRDAGTKYKVIAFIDDDPKKAHKKLEGVTIFNVTNDLESLLANNDVDHLIQKY